MFAVVPQELIQQQTCSLMNKRMCQEGALLFCTISLQNEKKHRIGSHCTPLEARVQGTWVNFALLKRVQLIGFHDYFVEILQVHCKSQICGKKVGFIATTPT